MKFATKPIRYYLSHPRHIATLPWEIKNSNFLHIFSRYGRKCKQYWIFSTSMNTRLPWYLTDSAVSLRLVLLTQSLTVSTFSSVRPLCGLPLPGRLSTVSVSSCSQEIRLSTSLLCTPSNTIFLIKILSGSKNQLLDKPWWRNTMLIVDKHCSDVCCDKFPVPKIDRKS